MKIDKYECARPDCGAFYEKKTHNQKYCGTECCRIATNKRIMEKYYARQAQRQGRARYCSECQTTRLSRYNDSTICSSCELKRTEESRNNVVSMFAAVSWL